MFLMQPSVYKDCLHEDLSFLDLDAIFKCLTNLYIETQALEKLK